MSSSTTSPAQQGPAPGTCQSLIDKRLERTRAQVKGVDVSAGLMALSGAMLGYLLLATVIDQWVLVGGLGFRGRLAMFAVLVIGAGWYFVRRVMPAITGRISPVYAAETIERSRPSLKNSLINFLMLRREAKELPPVIYRAVEYRAAADLSQMNVDAAVDHGRVIRLGYLLTLLVTVAALYLVFSPKNPLVSFGRVMWPWANIEAPTRVRFADVRPGDVKTFRGEFLTVSAEVSGVKEGEAVAVYYSSADGQIADQAVPMVRAQGEYRHRAALPPESLGLQQDLQYYLAAGDTRTRAFKVEVQVSPVVNVDRLEYHYPAYTGIPKRAVEGEGDIRAIVGTRVTVHATANQEIARAEIDLGCDSLHLERMSPNGTEATGQIVLRLTKDDPPRAEVDCYQIRFADRQGRENRQPIRHRIEVIRDLPPEVEILTPKEPEVDVPENGQLEIRVRAADPDFALRRVLIRAERNREALKIEPLMERPQPGDPHKGEFTAAYQFQPARLGLKAGDRVTYWAEAEDNKYLEEDPKPNHSETAKQLIRIVGADQQSPQQRQEQQKQGQQKPQPGQQGRDQQNQRPQDQDGQGQNQQQQGQKPENQQGKPQNQQQQGQGEGQQDKQQGKGQEQKDQQAHDKQSQKEPVDGETNPGDAFDKMSKFFKDKQPQDGQQQDQQKQDQLAQKSDQKQDKQQGKEQGKEQQGKEQQGKEQQGKEQQGKEQQGKEQQGKEQQGKEQQGKEQQGKEQQGKEQQGKEQQGKGQGDQKQSASPGERSEGQKQGQGGQAAERREAGGEPGKQGSAEKPDQQRTPGQDAMGQAQAKPEAGQGAKGQGTGNREQGTGEGQSQPKPEAKGGDPEGSSGKAGAGKSSDQKAGSPSPQEGNQPRDKKAGTPEGMKPDSHQDQAQSPSNSPKDSDSKGETAGDRSGGGEKGGGQKANQSGTGSAGTHTAAEQGASKSDQKGDGETGQRAGDQSKSKSPTGSMAKQQGQGSRSGQSNDQQAGKEGSSSDKGSQQGKSTAQGQASSNPQGPKGDQSGTVQAGGEQAKDFIPPKPELAEGDNPDLRYANKQVDLTLRRLRDELAKDKPDADLQKRLGWSREKLQEFYGRWTEMKRAADQDPPAGPARKKFNEALKSLGLRPQGTELKGGAAPQDQLRNLRESLRADPPPEWQEYLKAYTKGVAGQK